LIPSLSSPDNVNQAEIAVINGITKQSPTVAGAATPSKGWCKRSICWLREKPPSPSMASVMIIFLQIATVMCRIIMTVALERHSRRYAARDKVETTQRLANSLKKIKHRVYDSQGQWISRDGRVGPLAQHY
jgi:hypothetical protein